MSSSGCLFGFQGAAWAHTSTYTRPCIAGSWIGYQCLMPSIVHRIVTHSFLDNISRASTRSNLPSNTTTTCSILVAYIPQSGLSTSTPYQIRRPHRYLRYESSTRSDIFTTRTTQHREPNYPSTFVPPWRTYILFQPSSSYSSYNISSVL